MAFFKPILYGKYTAGVFNLYDRNTEDIYPSIWMTVANCLFEFFFMFRKFYFIFGNNFNFLDFTCRNEQVIYQI